MNARDRRRMRRELNRRVQAAPPGAGSSRWVAFPVPARLVRSRSLFARVLLSKLRFLWSTYQRWEYDVWAASTTEAHWFRLQRGEVSVCVEVPGGVVVRGVYVHVDPDVEPQVIASSIVLGDVTLLSQPAPLSTMVLDPWPQSRSPGSPLAIRVAEGGERLQVQLSVPDDVPIPEDPTSALHVVYQKPVTDKDVSWPTFLQSSAFATAMRRATSYRWRWDPHRKVEKLLQHIEGGGAFHVEYRFAHNSGTAVPYETALAIRRGA